MNHHPRLLLTSTLFPEDSPTYIISLLDPPEKMREKQRNGSEFSRRKKIQKKSSQRQKRSRRMKSSPLQEPWDSTIRRSSSDMRVRYRCVFTCIISRCLPPKVKNEKCLITLSRLTPLLSVIRRALRDFVFRRSRTAK